MIFKISDDRMRDWSGVISAIHNCPNQLIKRLDWSDPPDRDAPLWLPPVMR